MEGWEDSENRTPAVRLVIRMHPERRIPKFEIEDVDESSQIAEDLDAALAEARER